MAAKKNVLGRGLGALLENYETDVTTKSTEKGTSDLEPKIVGTVTSIVLDKIETNPFQPRDNFNETTLKDLADSILKLGIVQPVTVRKLGYDKFQLISGERRYRAAKIAGLTEIPVYIRIANDQAMLEMSLVENIQRDDLNAIEIAISYNRLVKECKLTQEKLSERVGKKRSTITNYLRLLKLPAEIQIGIRDNKISMGHARALINVANEELQMEIFSKAVKYDLSVRQVEELVRNLGTHVKKGKPAIFLVSTPSKFQHLKEKLSDHLETGVDLKCYNNGKGKIVISFESDEDLERIVDSVSS